MDERIEKILKTDADARKRIALAQQQAKEVTNEVETEIEKLRLQYEKKADTRIREIKKQQQKEMTAIEEEKRENNVRILKTLENVSKEKTDNWVEEIYERVISD
ncbi:MAG: hypothetical protein IJU39_00750 [Clostridia bacterium]|nr:hypothetical protein [Clostridia bacterium]